MRDQLEREVCPGGGINIQYRTLQYRRGMALHCPRCGQDVADKLTGSRVGDTLTIPDHSRPYDG